MDDESLERALRETNAELLRRIEDLSFVRLVGDALSGEVDPAAIGRSLVAALRDELSLTSAALWVVDDLAGGVRLSAVARESGLPIATADATLVPFAAGPLGDASGGAVIRLAPAAEGNTPAGLDGAECSLLYPVCARGRTLGVMGIGVGEDALDPEHERLLGLVAPVVALALEAAALHARLEAENRTLRAELGARGGEETLIGVSPAFRHMLEVVDRLADADITVLVRGESGTGKECVARALHHRGRRRTGPFVAVNCAALPETLLESELFGIERGVATGVDRRPGLIERASGGTLFLDEVGDMSAVVQAKILRVLEEHEVQRVGAAHPVPVDVRVVAATHRDLDQRVREGQFRADLYFRLKVATVVVPPLGERRGDIPLLAQHFVARFSTKHGRTARLSPAALAALTARAWPGNVRELANALEHAVVLAAGPSIEPGDLVDPPEPAAAGPGFALRQTVEAAADGAERELIERALDAAGRSRTRAAQLLGIGRRTLQYKIKRYGLR